MGYSTLKSDVRDGAVVSGIKPVTLSIAIYLCWNLCPDTDQSVSLCFDIAISIIQKRRVSKQKNILLHFLSFLVFSVSVLSVPNLRTYYMLSWESS